MRKWGEQRWLLPLLSRAGQGLWGQERLQPGLREPRPLALAPGPPHAPASTVSDTWQDGRRCPPPLYSQGFPSSGEDSSEP